MHTLSPSAGLSLPFSSSLKEYHFIHLPDTQQMAVSRTSVHAQKDIHVDCSTMPLHLTSPDTGSRHTRGKNRGQLFWINRKSCGRFPQEELCHLGPFPADSAQPVTPCKGNGSGAGCSGVTDGGWQSLSVTSSHGEGELPPGR